jgi:hypothetical protein
MSHSDSYLCLLVRFLLPCAAVAGGSLISAVAGFLRHGDAQVRALVQTLLRKASRPLLALVERWVTEGELADPYHEFFVAADPTVPLTDPARMWRHKYALRAHMVGYGPARDETRRRPRRPQCPLHRI